MQLIERPGYSGRKKFERIKHWNEQYGEGNWTLIWKWGELLLNFQQACLIYEDAYYHDSFIREELWKQIFQKAYDVFDNAETNIQSGLDYTIQEAYSTHLQDISVRRVGIRRGWKFHGDRLIQIRSKDTEGYLLSPGIVPFHIPEMIERPDILPSWAEPNSVEAFYQNNKWLTLLEKFK